MSRGGAWAELPGTRPAPKHAHLPSPPPHPLGRQPCREAGAPPSGRGLALLPGAAEAASGAGHADMAEAVRQELSALAAIFCGPHEWEMLSCSGESPISHPAATAGSRGGPGVTWPRAGVGAEWRGAACARSALPWTRPPPTLGSPGY